MNRQKMLQMLADDLNSMSDQELIKSYENNGMKVISYKPGTEGHICFSDNCGKI